MPLQERNDKGKREERLRAVGKDVILSDGRWHGGDVMMTANLYPVYDGADVTATVSHLNAVGPALDGEMVPRNVERLGIREREVVETEGRGGCRRRGREPE